MATIFVVPAGYAAPGDCLQWGVAGDWKIIQTDGTQSVVKLEQNDSQFNGSAQYSYFRNVEHSIGIDSSDHVSSSGPMVGTINGSVFEATVYWADNSIGIYTGQIGQQGLITGSTYDRNNPSNRADWHSSRVADCLSRESVAAPSAPEPPREVVNAPSRVKQPEAGASQPVSICDSARAAKARNSPAAPGLAQKCLASGGTMTPPPPPPPPIESTQLELLEARGALISETDPLSIALRTQQQEGTSLRGFDVGMAAAENDTAPGPGKQHIRDSLPQEQRSGFDAAVQFSLERNKYKDLAKTGAAITNEDPFVEAASRGGNAVMYSLGFDIATALFGDPAMGATGSTAVGPGAMKIRDSLSAESRRGFDASVKFHLARDYKV